MQGEHLRSDHDLLETLCSDYEKAFLHRYSRDNRKQWRILFAGVTLCGYEQFYISDQLHSCNLKMLQ